MKRSAPGPSAEQLVVIFDRTLASFWRRAQLTLGDVTLTAIVERVLYNAAERYPLFSSLKVEGSGVSCQGLREHVSAQNEGLFREAVRFVLVEFLTVIGNLTAEILTPALHAELLKVAP